MKISPTSSLLLSRHAASASAIAALLHPLAEVVLHDLATGRIAGIWNAFSGRAAGMDSLVEDEVSEASGEGVLGPYEKTGPDGRHHKSVTAVLNDDEGRAAGLLCINVDVSQFDAAARLLSAFSATAAPRPKSLFAGDWREEINVALHDWLRGRGLPITALKRPDRVALVAMLDERGLFQTRNAVDHLAGLLGASRASIYNYLADARRRETKDMTS